jgi:uncharacterized protein
MNLFLFISCLLIGSIAMSSEVVKVEMADKVFLVGKLYTPNSSKDKKPAILIIEGSGKSGFTDEPVTSPFNQLGEALAAKGFVVLKFNKRGSGENHQNGSFWKSTFLIDNQDSQSFLDVLKKRPDVDVNKIFLIGHSFGGPHSLVLSEKNQIAGIVMLTSTIGPIDQLMIEQNRIAMEIQKEPTEMIEKYIKKLTQDLESVKSGQYKCVAPDCSIIDGAEVMEESIQVPYLKEVLNIDFKKTALKQPSPVLFIFGHSDFVIPESTILDVEEKLVKKDPKKFGLKVIKKLDHFMIEHESKHESMKGAFQAQKEKVFKAISTELVSLISEWTHQKI